MDVVYSRVYGSMRREETRGLNERTKEWNK